ncbi:MAG: ATP-binding protein [Micromonosporaceae bacterium]
MTGDPAVRAGTSTSLQTYLGLGALPSAVGCARLHARSVMHEWDLTSVADTVELVVSELVTNAVRASTGPDGRPRYNTKTGLPLVHLRLSSDRAHVFIEVWDQDSRLPVAKAAGGDDESGRGLMLVEALCQHWDSAVAPGRGGKVVRAQVRVI